MCIWLVISTFLSKLKDFARSQTFTYIVKVVIFRTGARQRDVITEHEKSDTWPISFDDPE